MIELSSRQFLIIRLLQKSHQPLSAKTLSRLLDISPRTLRNDITAINSYSQDFEISSSRNGYQLKIISENALMLIQDIKISDQSKSTITVLQYLLNHSKSHLLDIALDCYMSESSVSRCIQSLKPLMKKFNLTIERKKDYFTIIGSEYDKRNLFAHLIQIEAHHSVSHYKNFQQYFHDFNIEDIRKIIDKILKKYSIQVDDIHYHNLIINTSISLQRIFYGNNIEPLPFSYSISKDETISQLSNELCHTLEKYYAIKFSQTDYEYMQILCIGSIKIDENNYEDNILYNDYSFVYKVKEILDDMILHYALHLDYQLSLNHFALHIHRLFFRSHSSLYFQNDFNNNIKHTHPFIYELAVYFAYRFKESFNIDINDNEIGLLAIYIGLMIESNNTTQPYLKAICICPNYNDLRRHFSNQFLLNFSDSVQLTGFVSSLSEIKEQKYDLLITTINDYNDKNCINVSPLLLPQDIERLTLKIQILKELQKKEVIKKELSKYIDKSLFFKNVDVHCKKDAILFLCNQMLKHGDAKTDFVDSVFEREKISSTSFFNKFAVPHAIEFGSVKTRISFLITDQPIPWEEDTHVNLVMLISINEKDIMMFNTIYSSIVDLLLDESSFEQLIQIETFEKLAEYLESYVLH